MPQSQHSESPSSLASMGWRIVSLWSKSAGKLMSRLVFTAEGWSVSQLRLPNSGCTSLPSGSTHTHRFFLLRAVCSSMLLSTFTLSGRAPSPCHRIITCAAWNDCHFSPSSSRSVVTISNFPCACTHASAQTSLSSRGNGLATRLLRLCPLQP